jgi:hypothetical protein
MSTIVVMQYNPCKRNTRSIIITQLKPAPQLMHEIQTEIEIFNDDVTLIYTYVAVLTTIPVL